MKLSLSLLLFLVTEIVNYIETVFLCLKKQRDSYESNDSRLILEHNLDIYQLLLKHYIWEKNLLEVFSSSILVL